MNDPEKCKVSLILSNVFVAECEREKGHKGRHKGISEKPIYTKLEWALKREKNK